MLSFGSIPSFTIEIFQWSQLGSPGGQEGVNWVQGRVRKIPQLFLSCLANEAAPSSLVTTCSVKYIFILSDFYA